ncbi:hypothetical protein LJR255_002377 [Pararhizobium sp. LjRoot255]|uniref:hypothetical protein n=1 Tax=Pararhizobium sp. LjRoot255 TaxID=3342298 RepID=UPI003ED071AB
MEIKKNILVSPRAEKLLLKHYMEDDKDHPSELNIIPKLIYVVAYKDGHGNIIDGEVLGYRLVRGEIKYTNDKLAFPFQNGRKFFTVEFSAEEYDDTCQYYLDYEDGSILLLKETFDFRCMA